MQAQLGTSTEETLAVQEKNSRLQLMSNGNSSRAFVSHEHGAKQKRGETVKPGKTWPHLKDSSAHCPVPTKTKTKDNTK